jgi:ubiquitin carboxyl-terminal hydrolase 34
MRSFAEMRILWRQICYLQRKSVRSFHEISDLDVCRGAARRLFWKHLFPPFEREETADLTAGSVGSSRPILYHQSRALLIEIVFALIGDDSRQLYWLLQDLDDLVPFDDDDDGRSALVRLKSAADLDQGENYAYELPVQFERSKAIRASCGYVGLKNLSNTCYLNSLFTQLFMNTEFRQFMMAAEVHDREYSQNLLFQTQTLFGNMQGSIRRYMVPEECVASIKTYEDTQIDIHNQMDVDEFYNLLFDRWEGQLLTAEAKRQFRSFYGGQLVQQVASKECEHISERLEPFSAIQCDIKGKSTLQESMQAYVDGEIMAGGEFSLLHCVHIQLLTNFKTTSTSAQVAIVTLML